MKGTEGAGGDRFGGRHAAGGRSAGYGGGGGLQTLRRLRRDEHATPARACSRSSKKGAFFESLNANVVYAVCVRFQPGKTSASGARKRPRAPST